MPKISAPTVAEHREQQHAQVLQAARELMERDGQLPSLGAVAKHCGLARTSLYQYARSRSDLVAQLLVASFEEWASAVGEAMDAAGDDPEARLLAYVHSNLELWSVWSRNAVMAAAAQEPEAMRDPEVKRAHESLQPRLVEALVRVGMTQAEALPYSQYLDTAIHRAAELLLQQEDAGPVTAGLERMVRAAFAAA